MAKLRRPRLEVATRFGLSAHIGQAVDADSGEWVPDLIHLRDRESVIIFNLADAKRLHAFLTSAIAYLEAQKGGA